MKCVLFCTEHVYILKSTIFVPLEFVNRRSREWEWKKGRERLPKHDANEFVTAGLSVEEMYKLMIGSVVPRPIAWVSTRSKDGVLNLAPFSFLPWLRATHPHCSFPLDQA